MTVPCIELRGAPAGARFRHGLQGGRQRNKVNKVDNKVDKVNKVSRVDRVYRVYKVNRMNKVNKVNKVHKVYKVGREHRIESKQVGFRVQGSRFRV
eukprot:2057614-Rhodomonas_salina.1